MLLPFVLLFFFFFATGSLLRVEFGEFAGIDANTLHVVEDKIHLFDGAGHDFHKVFVNGLQNRLGSRLLWKARTR